jgi:hypothetical protein
MDIVILLKKLKLPNKSLEKIFLYTEDIRLAATYCEDLAKQLYDPTIHNTKFLIRKENINVVKILIYKNLSYNFEVQLLDYAYDNNYQEMFTYIWRNMRTEIDNDYYIVSALRDNYKEIFDTIFITYAENDDYLFIEYDDLIEAVEHNNVEMFKKLYEFGAYKPSMGILHESYAHKSYELAEYLETFIEDASNESLMNQNNLESISCIDALRQLNLPKNLLRKIILYTDDINLIFAFNKHLAMVIYNREDHDKMILQKDNAYIINLMIHSVYDICESEFSIHVFEHNSTDIYKYMFKINGVPFTNMNDDYDITIQLSICNNCKEIFEFLFNLCIINGKDLSCIGRDTLKTASQYNEVELWKKLFKYGSFVSQPTLLKHAKKYNSYKLIEYLESLYLLKNKDDYDIYDDSDESDDGNTDEENIETLLRYKTSNAINVIHTLKRLNLPHEIIEKIIIHTADIYLIAAFDRKLIKFIYLTKIHTYSYKIRYLKPHTNQTYIEIQILDNLIVDIEEIVTIIITRNCINLFRFLLLLLNGLYDHHYIYYDKLIDLAIKNNHIEIFEILANRFIKYEDDLYVYVESLQIATEHNNVELFKTIYKYDQDIKYKSVLIEARYNESNELVKYLESLPGDFARED